MEIRQIDVQDDVLLRAVYDIDSRAMLLGREEMKHWTWQEMAALFQKPDPGERFAMLGGWSDGRLVGTGTVFLPILDNVEKAWVHVTVDPPCQRQGHGTALLDAILEIAEAEGRTVVMSESKVPIAHLDDHGYRRFAERAGFTFANVEVVRELELPVPADEVAAWVAEALPKTRGYRIETHVNGVPDDLLPSYLFLLGQLSVDAPTGAVDFEEEQMTPDRYRQNQESLLAAGRTIYDTLAVVDTEDGPVVAAHSTVSVPAPPKTDVSQWGTFVHREHRGHRLGLATKAANLRAVQKAHPGMERIVTQNAETNQWMIAVNVLMGFEPVEASLEMVRRAAGS